jgi:hypothetical protein
MRRRPPRPPALRRPDDRHKGCRHRIRASSEIGAEEILARIRSAHSNGTPQHLATVPFLGDRSHGFFRRHWEDYVEEEDEDVAAGVFEAEDHESVRTSRPSPSDDQAAGSRRSAAPARA